MLSSEISFDKWTRVRTEGRYPRRTVGEHNVAQHRVLEGCLIIILLAASEARTVDCYRFWQAHKEGRLLAATNLQVVKGTHRMAVAPAA